MGVERGGGDRVGDRRSIAAVPHDVSIRSDESSVDDLWTSVSEVHSFYIQMKYVVVTGGVVSGLGKGVTASSIGVLLKGCGYRTTHIKIGEL